MPPSVPFSIQLPGVPEGQTPASPAPAGVSTPGDISSSPRATMPTALPQTGVSSSVVPVPTRVISVRPSITRTTPTVTRIGEPGPTRATTLTPDPTETVVAGPPFIIRSAATSTPSDPGTTPESTPTPSATVAGPVAPTIPPPTEGPSSRTTPLPSPTTGPPGAPPPNVAPTADGGDTRKANIGEGTRFDATRSSDPDGEIIGFLWDFGDGTAATFASGDHTFTGDGEYHVSLTVTDDDGETGSDTYTVAVKRKWTLKLEVSTQPAEAVGLGSLFLGVNHRCPEAAGCAGPMPPSLPGLTSFNVYVCHPPANQLPCKDSLEPDQLLSKSWLPWEEVRSWVVEVSDPDRILERITFFWDPSELPSEFTLKIVDSGGFVNMRSAPDGPQYPLDMKKGKATRSFLICSQVTGATTSEPCPEFPKGCPERDRAEPGQLR